MCIDKLFGFIPFILDFYNLNFLHYNFHFLVFFVHLKCVSKTKYMKKIQGYYSEMEKYHLSQLMLCI